MIDVFNSLVESQKLPIFSVAGEPYNELLARIALNAEVDIIVLGGMGLKYDDYLFFRDTLEEAGALSRAILYVHTAADPVVECLLVRTVSRRRRAFRSRRQAGARAAHRHDQLRRFAQGGGRDHGADPIYARLPRRPLQPAGGALREGRGL